MKNQFSVDTTEIEKYRYFKNDALKIFDNKEAVKNCYKLVI